MSDQTRPADVLHFWFGPEPGPARRQWFEKSDSFDREVAARFLAAYEAGASGRLAGWRESPRDCLALIVLLDQFPRNMFRGTPRAFAADPLALDAARHAVALGYDRPMLPVERLFLYLPFEHSESLADQIRAWVPGRYVTLGTDGFGRSDTRPALRRFFEVDRYHVAVAALKALADEGKVPKGKVKEAIKAYEIDPDRTDPAKA